MSKDKILSAYGDGWYSGFLEAQKLSREEDISDYSDHQILTMSEQAETDSQINKTQ
jgi:hypothetical protein